MSDGSNPNILMTALAKAVSQVPNDLSWSENIRLTKGSDFHKLNNYGIVTVGVCSIMLAHYVSKNDAL